MCLNATTQNSLCYHLGFFVPPPRILYATNYNSLYQNLTFFTSPPRILYTTTQDSIYHHLGFFIAAPRILYTTSQGSLYHHLGFFIRPPRIPVGDEIVSQSVKRYQLPHIKIISPLLESPLPFLKILHPPHLIRKSIILSFPY